MAPRLQLRVYDPTYTTPRATAEGVAEGLAGLVKSKERAFRDPLNDSGHGTFVMQNTDADLALVGYGDVVAWELDGSVVWASTVESKHRVHVHKTAAQKRTTIGGRGLIAEWERAIWYPDGGVDRTPFVDTRIFNYAAFDFDDSAWVLATATSPLYFDASQRFAWPEGWPDNSAEWIWDRDSSSTGVPAGTVYFRREFTLASDVRVQMWAACDDEYEVWLDGGLLFSSSGFYVGKCQYVELDMDAGDHVIAVKATNLNNLRAGFLFSMIEKTNTGAYGSVLTRSNTTNWYVEGYPGADPGMTPGEVLRHFREEAQARGDLSGWTDDFSDTHDSDGVAWPTTADIAFPVGLDGLSVLRQLAETYIDFDFDPATKTLHAYVYGGKGGASGVTLAEGTNLQEYTATGNAALAKRILSRYERGYTEDSDGAATVEAELFMSLAQVRTTDEVGRIAAKVLETFRDARTGAVFSVMPGTDEPYVAFGKGDTLTGPDEEGNNDTLRVKALAYAETPTGVPKLGGELGDLDGLEEEKLQRWLRRMATGAVGGRVESVAPARPGLSSPTERSQSRLEKFSFPGAITAGVITGEQTVPYNLRLVLFIIRAQTAGSGDTTVRIYIDNVGHTDLTFASTATDEAEFVSIDVTPGQQIKVGLPAIGSGLADVTVEPYWAA